MEIQLVYKDNRQKLTTRLLIAELDKRGFRNLSRATVERDLVEVARGNRFVRNIVQESGYSQMIKEMFEDIAIANERLWTWLDNPPQITRQKIKSDPTSETGHVVTESIVETISPLSILRMIIETGTAKKLLLSGHVLNASVIMLGDKFKIMEKKIQEAGNQDFLMKEKDEMIKTMKTAIEEYRLKQQQEEEIKRQKMLFGVEPEVKDKGITL